MRQPLARALNGVGLDAADVAARLRVDPKTVERWLTGRMPYPRHRAALIELTGWHERDLWPGVARPASEDSASSEVLCTYPHRSAVPSDAWHHLIEHAEREIGILAYSSLFLAENTAAQRLLRKKARSGVRVRIALGDSDGGHVAQRGLDEGIADVMAARIRNALMLYRPLTDEADIHLRLHDTVLYNSIYLADDQLMVNAHVYGVPASDAPVFHLRQRSVEGMASTYVDSFERVWATSRDFTS